MNLLLSVTVVAAAVIAPLPSGAAAAAAAGASPLDAARRAADEVSFRGSVEVQWRDGAVARHEQLTVEDASGSLLLRGGTSVMAFPGQERLVQHGAEWDVLWPASLGSHARPDAHDKYETAPGGQVPVAGRVTDVVEVRQGRAPLERLYLDTETGLLLRRDQLDPSGALDRKVEFTSLTIGAPAPPNRRPAGAVDQSPRPVSAARQPSAALAPTALPDGYRRLGVYRQAGVVHLLYSDGLYDLSLFEQTGRLTRSDLPGGGTAVRVAGAPGRVYAWPGGHVVVWQAGRNVLTMVSDAPVDQLLRAGASVRGRNPAPSLLTRLRQAARALVAPLSD